MAETIRLQRWFDKVWHDRNEDAIDELLHKDARFYGLETDKTKSGPEAFKPFYKSFSESFPSIHVQLEPIFNNDEFEAAHCVVTGTNSDGKNVEFTGIVIARFDGGQLVEGWNGFDFLSMYQQLGFQLTSAQ